MHKLFYSKLLELAADYINYLSLRVDPDTWADRTFVVAVFKDMSP